MKRITAFVASILLLFSLAACGADQRPENTGTATPPAQTERDPSRETETEPEVEDNTSDNPAPAPEGTGDGVLIAYFAYSENIGDTSGMTVDAITSASLNQATDNEDGNLQIIAQVIQERTGADVHHILVTEPYDPDYNTMRDRAYDELDDGTLPALQSQVENLEQYDVIYLGTPVWSGDMPAPVASFLTDNDLSGKTIIPFGIHLGSGFGRITSKIEELCPNATLLDGFTIQASTANDTVRSEAGAWLDGLNVD